MATATQALVIPRNLEYLPIGLFGSVMGLTGLSVAWKLAHARSPGSRRGN
jgi:tellurite resistance protein